MRVVCVLLCFAFTRQFQLLQNCLLNYADHRGCLVWMSILQNMPRFCHKG